MVDSLYYLSRKIAERCENSFVDYRINYQKLCYLTRQITKDLNLASGWQCFKVQCYILVTFVNIVEYSGEDSLWLLWPSCTLVSPDDKCQLPFPIGASFGNEEDKTKNDFIAEFHF